jgi:hypothetical protein
MIDPASARPALGYVRRYPGHGPAATARLRQRLVECARSNGYYLIDVHVEESQTDPSAFDQLIAAIATARAEAVVVPTAAHLGREESSESKLAQLRRMTKVRVLVSAHHAP